MGENKPVDSEAITYTRQLGKLRKIRMEGPEEKTNKSSQKMDWETRNSILGVLIVAHKVIAKPVTICICLKGKTHHQGVYKVQEILQINRVMLLRILIFSQFSIISLLILNVTYYQLVC